MSNDKLFIAPKIKVGYQKRDDTYTKQLAYVIYYDLKGKLRKEQSWESWRDKKIAPKEFDNVPTEGFVLNRGAGGVRESWGWNARQEYVRVYDPRDFEFEITIPNLLFILKECDCSRGKGLEGKFVYAWSGSSLVLLPAECEDAKKSAQFTVAQNVYVKPKDLVPGYTYKNKRMENVVFLGRFDKHTSIVREWRRGGRDSFQAPAINRFVFLSEAAGGKRSFIFLSDSKTISQLVSDKIIDDYAHYVKKYERSAWGSPVKEFFTKTRKMLEKYEKPANAHYHNRPSENWCIDKGDGTFEQWATEWRNDDPNKINDVVRRGVSSVKDGLHIWVPSATEQRAFHPDVVISGVSRDYWYRQSHRSTIDYVEPTDKELWVRLESGAEFRMEGDNIKDSWKYGD